MSDSVDAPQEGPALLRPLVCSSANTPASQFALAESRFHICHIGEPRAQAVETGITEPVLGSMCKKFHVLLLVLASTFLSKTIATFTSTRELHVRDISERLLLSFQVQFPCFIFNSIPFLECQFIF